MDEPTAPFGLLDVQGDGRGIEEARRCTGCSISRRLASAGAAAGGECGELFHLAWAQVLGALSGREDVVFGTVLFGRMQGGEGADRAHGVVHQHAAGAALMMVTQASRPSVRQTHAQLAHLLRHEHALAGVGAALQWRTGPDAAVYRAVELPACPSRGRAEQISLGRHRGARVARSAQTIL